MSISLIPVVRVNADPCVVRWVGRKGLSVKILTWCNLTVDAGSGVETVSPNAKICGNCKTSIDGASS